MRPIWSLPLAFLLLAGCTVGPDYEAPQLAVPQNFQSIQTDAVPVELESWWRGFQDPLLDRLVSEAVANNLPLKIAAQRIAAARADRDAVASAEEPTLGASASGINARSSRMQVWPHGVGEYKTYRFGLEGSWELDLFGGTRRTIEAADAVTQVAEEDRRGILVALLGELAADYAILRSNQHRLDIAHRNIEAEQNALALTRRALTAGLGTDVDVTRAEAAVRQSEARVPTLEADTQRMVHAIAVLLGRYPEDLSVDIFSVGGREVKEPPLPATIPSEVLRNRPDIRQAERQIAAATARIGVATADLFPKFKIPFGIGPMASNLGNLFNAQSLVWTLGATASQTISDGGRNDARIRAAEAIAEQDRLNYRQTILTAFREIEDRLTGYDAERRRHTLLTAAVVDEKKAFDQTMRLYGRGLTDFYKVLDSERAMFQAEDGLAQSELAQTLDLIGLYRGLGGGWQAAEAIQ